MLNSSMYKEILSIIKPFKNLVISPVTLWRSRYFSIVLRPSPTQHFICNNCFYQQRFLNKCLLNIQEVKNYCKAASYRSEHTFQEVLFLNIAASINRFQDL